MTPVLRNLALNALYYAVTLGILPFAALSLERRVGGPVEPPGILRGMGVVLGIAGGLLQVWSVVLLHTRGGGTPSPVAPPEKLVSDGPYAWLRNPINLGESLLFLGLAAWFASWALVLYAVLAWLSFQVFIIAWEEPRHRRLFGGEFVSYCHCVSRWLPRLPPTPE